jgi:hypothetical protein
MDERRPKYEAPVVVHLGAASRGTGECQPGNSDVETCVSGPAAPVGCWFGNAAASVCLSGPGYRCPCSNGDCFSYCCGSGSCDIIGGC